jgi:hypothetical protein
VIAFDCTWLLICRLFSATNAVTLVWNDSPCDMVPICAIAVPEIPADLTKALGVGSVANQTGNAEFPTILLGAPPEQHHLDGLEHDVDVQRKREVLNIVEIVFQL